MAIAQLKKIEEYLWEIPASARITAAALRAQLETEGIAVYAGSRRGLTEEAPFAYKDLDEVVDVMSAAGIVKKVARLRPIAVITG